MVSIQVAHMGTTWKDYLSVLAGDATLINQHFGDVVYSVNVLFQLELNMAMNTSNISAAISAMEKVLNEKHVELKSGLAKPVKIYKEEEMKWLNKLRFAFQLIIIWLAFICFPKFLPAAEYPIATTRISFTVFKLSLKSVSFDGHSMYKDDVPLSEASVAGSF